jgi:hypothetical protein
MGGPCNAGVHTYIHTYIHSCLNICENARLTVVIWLIGIRSGSTCSKSMHCWPVPRDSHLGALWLAFWHALRTVHLKQIYVLHLLLSSAALGLLHNDYGINVKTCWTGTERTLVFYWEPGEGKKTPWLLSASELCRPSDRRFLAK